MPQYDIRYLDGDGSVKAKIATECANDTHAKVMAHAMRAEGSKRIEVWDGPTLIYERGERVMPDAPSWPRVSGSSFR
jgi:hypothetical protein